MTIETLSQDGAAAPEPSGLEQALAAPGDALSDPGPGERSGLSSRIAEEILDDGWEQSTGEGTTGAPERAPEIDDPARAVGDDPAHPIHGSMAGEFEER